MSCLQYDEGPDTLDLVSWHRCDQDGDSDQPIRLSAERDSPLSTSINKAGDCLWKNVRVSVVLTRRNVGSIADRRMLDGWCRTISTVHVSTQSSLLFLLLGLTWYVPCF